MTHAIPVDDFAPDRAAIAAVIVGVTAFAVAQGLTYPLISLVLEHRKVSPSLIGFNAGCFAAGAWRRPRLLSDGFRGLLGVIG